MEFETAQRTVEKGISTFNIFFIILSVIAAAIFIFVLVYMFSPKLRAKMGRKDIKATKMLIEENKEDLKTINTTLAKANAEGLEIRTRAIKKGLTEDEKMFCKHCGEKIDKYSKFCNKCGKEQ